MSVRMSASSRLASGVPFFVISTVGTVSAHSRRPFGNVLPEPLGQKRGRERLRTGGSGRSRGLADQGASIASTISGASGFSDGSALDRRHRNFSKFHSTRRRAPASCVS